MIKLLQSARLALAILATAGMAAFANESPADAARSPRIQFAEPFFDFGRVQSDKVVSHDFVFTNIGTEVLEIMDVKSSCGCTAVTNWDRQIEPGKTSQLHVLFNTGGMAGVVRKHLWIASNDTNQPSTVLEFAANVWKLIDAFPPIAAFNFGPDSQTNETRVIRLVSNLEEPVTLSTPQWTNRSFAAELTTAKPGKEFDLRVSVLPPLKPGSQTATISIKTSAPEMPVIKITAYALVRPALTVSPPRILLPSPLTEPKNFDVIIRNNAKQALVLTAPEINTKNASVQLAEVQPGKVFKLTISFPAGFSPSAEQKIEVSIKSNLSQFPKIAVPITPLQPEAD